MNKQTKSTLWAILVICCALIIATLVWLGISTLMWTLMNLVLEDKIIWGSFIISIISMCILMICLMSSFYPAKKIWHNIIYNL